MNNNPVTCSNSTIETLEKGEMCSKLIKKHQNVGLVCLLLTLNIFHTFFSVSIVDFEQVNVSSEVYRFNENLVLSCMFLYYSIIIM